MGGTVSGFCFVYNIQAVSEWKFEGKRLEAGRKVVSLFQARKYKLGCANRIRQKKYLQVKFYCHRTLNSFMITCNLHNMKMPASKKRPYSLSNIEITIFFCNFRKIHIWIYKIFDQILKTKLIPS